MTFDDDFTPLDSLECTITDDLPSIQTALRRFAGRTDIGWDQSNAIDELLSNFNDYLGDLNEALAALKVEKNDRTNHP